MLHANRTRYFIPYLARRAKTPPRFSFMPLMDIAAHVGGLAMGAGEE